MTATYTPISSATLGSSTSSVTFSSIPQTYTDLVVVINDINSTGSFDTNIRFNEDSNANYSRTGLRGSGSTASSFAQTNNSAVILTADGSAGYARPAIVNIMNYSNTNTNKTIIDRVNDSANGLSFHVFLWRNTAAINSIQIYSSSTFASGATFSIYGIKAE
jgi:hypothetical protein